MTVDRYEPMPGITELPAWLWRKMGRGARIAAGLLLLAGIGAAIAIAPQISSGKDERATQERRERAQQRAERARTLQEQMRPHFARSTATTRAAIMDDMVTAVATHARIPRVECEPFPRTVGPTPRRRRGRFACVAVTSEFEGGVIGYPYRTLVDFQTGRFAYCRISGVPGPEREQLATTPKACGGS